ncbi:hypothetical protein ACF0H5_024361 [Mactra antiquata]
MVDRLFNLYTFKRMYLKLFILISISVSIVFSQTCEIVGGVPEILNKLPSDLIQQSANIVGNLHKCARSCTSTTQCQSFVYDREQGICNIYYVDYMNSQGSTPTPAVYYADKSSWDKGPCVNHDCAPGDVCLPVLSGFTCKRKRSTCFTQFQPQQCFEEFKEVLFDAPTILANVTRSSAITCVDFCLAQFPAFKSLLYDRDVGFCYCYSEHVFEYQTTSLSSLVPAVSTYDRIV